MSICCNVHKLPNVAVIKSIQTSYYYYYYYYNYYYYYYYCYYNYYFRRHGRLLRTSVSNMGGPAFKFRPKNRLS